MHAKTKASKPAKITIQVWRPVWSKLEKQLQATSLKRDAYVGKLVAHELQHLEDEMPISNSEAAEKFIDSQLRALLHGDVTPLSIALEPEVKAKLDRVLTTKRIVRDAFFNRLFLFLAFSPDIAGALLFRGLRDELEKWSNRTWTQVVWSECKHDGPFFDNVFSPFHAVEDPFWPIRACFDIVETEDKPDYVQWTDPETRRSVNMTSAFPEQLLQLPYRFYTAVLTDHDLRKSSGARKGPAASKKKGASSEVPPAFHNLYGLNCYLPNFYVKDHPDAKVYQQASDDLLANL